MVCRCHLAPLSATIHTIQATHSQCHTLLNSYNMARPPLLRSHLLQYRRLMVLPPEVLFPAHCYHAVHSAHKSLWIPPDMAHVMTCRSLKRSRSSHSLWVYHKRQREEQPHDTVRRLRNQLGAHPRASNVRPRHDSGRGPHNQWSGHPRRLQVRESRCLRYQWSGHPRLHNTQLPIRTTYHR